MLRALRKEIVNRLAEAASQTQSGPVSLLFWRDQLQRLAWCIRFAPVTKRSDVSCAQIHISLRNLKASGLVTSTEKWTRLAQQLATKFHCSSDFRSLQPVSEGLQLEIDSTLLAQAVLTDISTDQHNYARHSDLFTFRLLPHSYHVVPHSTGENIVVEFSSPNIAKPFHSGHLRSTILGQFVANICQWSGQNVIRLNYLGDWGTQFGLLGVGFEKYGDMDALKSDPIHHLFDVYVKINKEAKNDESVFEAGKVYFNRMEQGDECRMSFWRMCRQLSLDDYTNMYNRLGVKFTHVHGESMYHTAARQLVERLDNSGLLLRTEENGVGYLDLTQPSDSSPLHANLIKSDGSTLYLTRDIVAAIDRQQSFQATKLYYVVENGQHDHFTQLLRALVHLGHDWASDWTLDQFHIKFGHIEGMSTRQGNVVFLRDILDEAKQHTLEKMKATNTTKLSSAAEYTSVSESLGVAAVYIQDMKQRRGLNYQFSWQRMLNLNGNTGVFLQYTHARLNSLYLHMVCSLMVNCAAGLVDVAVNYELLVEEPALRLIQHLAQYDEALWRSYVELEPCHLVQYLFTLGRLVNVAHDELYVKNQPAEIAKVRLEMYSAAKSVVASGMLILGITPLDRI